MKLINRYTMSHHHPEVVSVPLGKTVEPSLRWILIGYYEVYGGFSRANAEQMAQSYIESLATELDRELKENEE